MSGAIHSHGRYGLGVTFFGMMGINTSSGSGGTTTTPVTGTFVKMEDSGSATIMDGTSGSGTPVDLSLLAMSLQLDTEADLYSLDTPVVLSVANGFEVGRTYGFCMHNGDLSDNVPAIGDRYWVIFYIDHSTDIATIQEVEISDATAQETGKRDTLVGRLMTLELNQISNLSPKLRRVLGLLGENQIVDGAVFDDAANVTEMRIRVFDTAANAAAAPRWTNREENADPAPAFPGSGEKLRQIITAQHLNPRQLRTLLLGDQRVSVGGGGDATDQIYDESSVQ